MPRLSKIGAAALAAFGWTSGGASAVVTANYLVVAGGGSGGANGSGGGGAGGYQASTTTLNPTLSYTVVIGAGGASVGAGAPANGTSGSNSSFGTLTASVGGGGGGQYNATGIAGGSGGGGGGNTPGNAGGAGTSGQGNAGGTGFPGTQPYGAGGGGAGAVGSNATSGGGGAGGVGLSSSISGTSTFYAGGGGGAGDSRAAGSGAGGNGGGGAGNAAAAGTNGTANTGGGGGGGGFSVQISGAGGSGIVIISYTGAQQFGGGVVTTAAGNTIHTFLTSGTLSPLSSLSASYLIVAGGGGASIGGGGAGGMLTGSGVTIDTNSTYLVTVGAGGNGATSGSNSAFSMVSTSAVGGGRGAGFNANGTTGGSGGGAATYFSASAFTGGTATSGQGSAGGNSVSDAGASNGGGGGGAGAVGANGTSGGNGGNGGVGLTSSISGTSTYYAGGGGGAGQGGSSGTGGLGGGGTGAYTSGTNGTANTGGGGGGGISTYSGAGGSGIVVIAYAGSTQQMSGGSVTITGGNVIHTFTSSGYLTPLTYYTNSLRFRSSATAYLSRTPTVTSNRQKFTMSFWFKRSKFDGAGICFLGSGVSGSDFIEFYINGTTGALQVYDPINSISIVTNAVFRDPAAWYHMVFSVDTTQATASNRIIIYVNGVQQSLSTATYPAQNANTYINSNTLQTIGTLYLSGTAYDKLDGYMTAINFIDGQALTPNSFGTVNSYGVWQPITYGGSYGTNGFYLPFTNKTSTTTLGYDFSPAGNNWTTNNISLTTGSTYDSMTDVPTLTSTTAANYCVLNPLNAVSTLSNGNLTASIGTVAWYSSVGTMGISSGKFYWELVYSGTFTLGMVGIASTTFVPTVNIYPGYTSDSYGYFSNNGNKYNNGANSAYGASYTTGDVIGVALDMTAGTLTFYKNNASQGTAFTGITGSYLPAFGSHNSTVNANFGQQPFAYTPPSGFVALNTYNL